MNQQNILTDDQRLDASVDDTLENREDELPELTTLRSDAQFDPREMHWAFMDGVSYVSMNFKELPAQVAPLRTALKRVLMDVLKNGSPIYANNLFRNFSRLADVIAERAETVSLITEVHVANYIGKYSINDKLGLESQLAALLNLWAKLQISGVSVDAVKLLNARKKPGNTKGEGVLTLDPVTGPLTDYELQQLTAELNNAYAAKILDEQYFYLAWLAILTGQRISQYCALKIKDLVRNEDEYGELSYEILIPKAKQRGQTIRDSFLHRPLTRLFGERLWQFCNQVRAEYPMYAENAPMFPSTRKHREGMQINEEFEGHWASNELANEFRKALSVLVPVSPRTMKPMNLAIGRFRDTLGTRAAQEGFGELVIAEILGHSDTQNVGVYTAALPEIASRIDKKLAGDLAPIANAFMGVILIRPEDATLAGDVTRQITDYRHAKSGVGSCGTKIDCRFNAPIACYTCPSFEAWLDAPHEKLLEHLMQDRDRLMASSGPRIAAVNDLTIIAAQRVVDECARIKRGIQNEEMRA